MDALTKIHATYQSNYNGCSLRAEVNGEQVNLEYHSSVPTATRQVAYDCINEITTELYPLCDDDGVFTETNDEAIEVMMRCIKSHFGDHIEVITNVDDFST